MPWFGRSQAEKSAQTSMGHSVGLMDFVLQAAIGVGDNSIESG
jgi:hypothetical protein